MVGCSKCDVPYCGHNKQSSGCTFFRFPSNPSRCKEWVRKVGQEDFAYQLVEKLHQLRFVCSCHFKEDDFRSQLKKRLKNIAVPSIFDDRIKDLPDEILHNFPPTQKSDMPMISFPIKMPPEDLEYTKKCERIENKIKRENISDHQLTKLDYKDELDLQLPPSKRYRSSVASKRTTFKKILEDAGIPGAETTSDVSKLLELILVERKATQEMQKELDKYVHISEKLQQKLNIYEENNQALCVSNTGKEANSLQILNNLNRNKCRKVRGERYSPEEILLAKGILKRSKSCYTFLQNFIKLPNERTLRRTIHQTTDLELPK